MFFVFIYELKQKSDFFLTKHDILKILVDFYVRLSQFFLSGSTFPEVDPNPAKCSGSGWIRICNTAN